MRDHNDTLAVEAGERFAFLRLTIPVGYEGKALCHGLLAELHATYGDTCIAGAARPQSDTGEVGGRDDKLSVRTIGDPSE